MCREQRDKLAGKAKVKMKKVKVIEKTVKRKKRQRERGDKRETAGSRTRPQQTT